MIIYIRYNVSFGFRRYKSLQIYYNIKNANNLHIFLKKFVHSNNVLHL